MRTGVIGTKIGSTSFFNDDTLEEKVVMTTNVIRAISKNVS